MSFLFPLYLLGAAAIAVPILLHLRRRPPKEHLLFSSLMFLEKTPERLTRRTKLERLLLLALRCLAVILLALAFGRPFLNSLSLPFERDSLSRALILVDRSASMQREDLWKRAVNEAEEALAKSGGTEEVAVAVFDESFEMVTEFSALASMGGEARRNLFDGALKEKKIEASWLGTDLGGALTHAADVLLAADLNQLATYREVVLISDFQEGADLKSLNENAWPEGISVRCIPVPADGAGNLSITLAATPTRSNLDEEEVYRVRIQNSSDSDEAKVSLLWKGFPETSIETLIAPGTGRILSSKPRPAEAKEGILTVTGDRHPFDNEVFISPVQPRPLRLLFVNESGISEDVGSLLFYLSRALQPTPSLSPVVTTAQSIGASATESSEVIVLSGEWSKETAGIARKFADAGGLVIAIPSAETASDSFSELTGQPWKLTEASVDEYALLADLDFDHPVLLPFARAQIRDFTKIRFWKHRNLELPDDPPKETHVIATFDGASPALLEHTTGKGAVFAILSGWEPKESQLALSSKFVPLLYSIFDHAGYSIRSAPTLYVGETEYERPGFYQETKNDTTFLTAVNLDPAEGRTAAFDPAVVFTEVGIPVLGKETSSPKHELSPEQLVRLESQEKEKQQKLWKWLVLFALILLTIETWLAGRRPGRTAGAVTTPANAATSS